MPYIVLNQTVRIRRGGKLRTYYRGDSVKVGRQQALQWLLDGTARDPFGQVKQINYADFPGKYGLLILARGEDVSPRFLEGLDKNLSIIYQPGWEGNLPCDYNILWSAAGALRINYLNYGLNIITKNWEMAAGLVNLEGTLSTYGSIEDRKGTLKLYNDLRLPVYNTNLLWIRSTKNTEVFTKSYAKLLSGGVHPGHAFARAWLESQPLLYTMPLR